MENVQNDEQVSITVDDGEIVMADSESDSTSTFGSEGFGAFTRNGMFKLEERDRHYNKIKERFLMGMGAFRKYTNVVAIHINKCSGNLIKRARSVMFQSFSDAVANKCGGDADLQKCLVWFFKG
ncbi:unnamed protein product [Ilex paraguariensis]|uniref:Uncharacterized protein n=1 Tax=Ilex paraguariensis TaxID=185542 RepID=A0ABC8UP39_9AQUA